MAAGCIQPRPETRRMFLNMRRYRRHLLTERRPRKRLALKYKIFKLSAEVWRAERNK